MSEPKVRYVINDNSVFDIEQDMGHMRGEQILYIEKSAYDAVVKERDEVKRISKEYSAAGEKLQETCDTLRKQLAVAREALKNASGMVYNLDVYDLCVCETALRKIDALEGEKK